MSDNNMDSLLENVKKMVDTGNIPNDVQQMLNGLQNKNSEKPDLSQVSPEMLNNLGNMLNSNNQTNSQNNSQSNENTNNFNIDMNTIMKMKSIMDNMNNKNDPRANLLYSLKPYLRDSKKNKLDQYVNLLSISKIAEVMNKNNDDKKK